MMVRRTVNLITGFDEIDGDYSFIELKVRMTLFRKSLCPSWGSPREPPMLKIGFPIISFQRGLAAELGFEEGPQNDI
jgi:hypothetical protein